MVICLLVAAFLRFPDLSTTPPGVHYDEAANGVLSIDIGLRGNLPIFIESYTGKEVLFFYLAGGLMRLIGGSVFALRLTAVYLSLLTIAATYWLGREMILDRRIALVAAGLLAVSFWHLLFSRLGFRAITQPLLQALTVAALLRGIRREQWRWLIVAGIFLGLAAYTYLAVRLFPILLFLAFLPMLFNRKTAAMRWQQLGATAVTALAIITPLVVYFLANPDRFWVRITQVAPGQEGLSLTDSLLKSLGMFFFIGDPYWRFNLPQRPLFNWFWGGLLVVGWVVCLWRIRKVPFDWQKSVLVLFVLTPFIMILPTALATNEIVPSNLRAIGLIPFIFYLPAIGLVTILQDLQDRYKRPPLTPTVFVILILLLFGGGYLTYRDYVQTWAQRTDVFYETDGDLTAVADFLRPLDITDQRLFVSALHYQHPTLAFLSDKYEQIDWLPNSAAFVFPNRGTAVYIYPHNSPLPEWAEPYLATAVAYPTSTDPIGKPAFAAYRLDQPPTIAIPNPVEANFGNAITLQGYEWETGKAGDILPLLLYWQVQGQPPADFKPFVHLEDRWGHRWSQIEMDAYPSAQWQAGDTIIQQVDVPVPSGTPAGYYHLRVGLFNEESGDRLARLDDNGRYAGNSYLIENAPIVAGGIPDSLSHPPFVLDAVVQPNLRLLGYERGANQAATGEPYGLAFWWVAEAPQPDMILRLELYKPDNTGIIWANTRPVHKTHPFDHWQTPQFLIDRQTLPLPDNLATGQYRLHLRLLNGVNDTLYETDLGSLNIEATERLFTQPTDIIPFEATFGNEVALIGYMLDEETGVLQLVWQALQPPTTDYTVFVHLLNADGTCCFWQQDVMPQQNQYPTGRWLTDEIVIDTYQLDLPTESGEYGLEIGLYMADNGRRLQVSQPNLADSDAVYLPPIQRE